jgi:hypothetical protein
VPTTQLPRFFDITQNLQRAHGFQATLDEIRGLIAPTWANLGQETMSSTQLLALDRCGRIGAAA